MEVFHVLMDIYRINYVGFFFLIPFHCPNETKCYGIPRDDFWTNY